MTWIRTIVALILAAAGAYEAMAAPRYVQIPANFEPRGYQLPFLENVGSEPWKKKRGVLIMHRRGGKDKTMISFTAGETTKRVGTYLYLLPQLKQARKIIWEGRDRDGFPFLDHFPAEYIKRKNNSELFLELANGSMFWIGGTDRMNLPGWIGSNPVGIVFSEWSRHNPIAWDYLRPILTENGGWAVFNYTPLGMNHGHDTYEMARHNPEWFCQRLTVDDTKRPDGTPVITQEMIQAEVDAGMDPDLVQQEFYCSFTAAIKGSYYGKLIEKAEKEGRIQDLPHDPAVPVHTCWDIGIGDSMVIWFYQLIGPWIHWIDYYEMSGEGLAHYASVLQKKAAERQFVYGYHWAPHDIEARDVSQDGRTRKEVAYDLGITFTTIPRHAVEDRIEAARNVIPKSRFDTGHCQHGLRCLKQYQKKWDEEKRVFLTRPLKDWAVHGADAFGYGAKSYRDDYGEDSPPHDEEDALVL